MHALKAAVLEMSPRTFAIVSPGMRSASSACCPDNRPTLVRFPLLTGTAFNEHAVESRQVLSR
jgi:hypothetical protein